MLRFILTFGLLATLGGAAAQAQTTPRSAAAKPRTSSARPQLKPRPAPAKTPTDGQGEYVAPGMTGAPDDRVTTDYENRPLKKPAARTSTLSSQAAARKAKP